MKSALIFFIAITTLTVSAQNVIPVVDFNGFFKNFKNGFFQQIEFQRIEEFKAGDNLVAYVDFRGNLRVYDGTKGMNVANLKVEYRVSDNLMTWRIGRTLNMWDSGVTQTLSYDVRNYWVKDEIIVFEDMRYGNVNVYYKGKVKTLYTSIGDLESPDFIGENIVAFRDNGNFNKVFWNGRIYDLDVWHEPFKFEGGTDILAFNDPINGTFAVFENGDFLDVEDFHVNDYKGGRGFVVYENRNENLMFYANGKQKQLTNFGATKWEVKDDIVVWSENNFTYAYIDGQKHEIARYIPENYVLKNGVVAFRNLMGGVSALIDGRVVVITNQMKSEYEIYGNSILVSLFNNSFIVYSNGKKYTL